MGSAWLRPLRPEPFSVAIVFLQDPTAHFSSASGLPPCPATPKCPLTLPILARRQPYV